MFKHMQQLARMQEAETGVQCVRMALIAVLQQCTRRHALQRSPRLNVCNRALTVRPSMASYVSCWLGPSVTGPELGPGAGTGVEPAGAGTGATRGSAERHTNDMTWVSPIWKNLVPSALIMG